MRQRIKRQLSKLWRGTAADVILVYHSIGSSRHSVSPENFQLQLEKLKCHFNVVPLLDLLEQKPSRTWPRAAITFDDGYQDNFTVAWPILQSLNLPVTVFVTTSFVGDSARICDWSPHFRGTPSMSWNQVLRLAQAGATIGAHTRSHPRLSDCNPAQCSEELECSRAEIQSRIGEPVHLLAYPFGQPHDFTNLTEDIAQSAGYRYAFTTLQRTLRSQDRPFALPRITVDPADTMGDFAAKVHGLRDFMALVDQARSIAVAAGLAHPLSATCTPCVPETL